MNNQRKIRVLIVDDSALMRIKLSGLINSDPECEVIATARNGEEAVKSVAILRPDVITLDLELPKMDGMSALKYIMSEWPTPIVIVTGFTRFGGEETLKCLEYGAVDLVIKPDATTFINFDSKKDELLQKIKIASRVKLSLLRPTLTQRPPAGKKAEAVLADKIVVIASSTGGPKALMQIMPKLEPNLRAGVVIVQHMPVGFTRSMAERLNLESRIRVREAQENDLARQGEVLIAQGGCHLVLERKDEKSAKVKLLMKLKENELCPSADITMKSIATLYGKNCLGVILTGMGSDGVEGLRAIKQAGGCTIAEDESTCIVYGMPKVAVEQGVADKVVPLPEIANEITKWSRGF